MHALVLQTLTCFVCSLAIGKAFSILSDQKKREQYDQYGHAMEPQQHRGNTRSGAQYYYADDDDDFSAEEIFNMFFGYGAGRFLSWREDMCRTTIWLPQVLLLVLIDVGNNPVPFISRPIQLTINHNP